MPALSTPTLQELKAFYPTTGSLETSMIQELTDYVINHIFLKIFGYDAATQIATGVLPDSASATFLGFQKFLALCVAYQHERDPLMSTNFGSKIISRANVVDPTNNQKSITLGDIEGTISIHSREAWKIVNNAKCQGVPNWGGYFSYKISRL